MAVRRTGVCPVVTPRARAGHNARGYPEGMSLITSVTSTAGRMAHDMRGSVHRARAEGEKRVLERAVAALTGKLAKKDAVIAEVTEEFVKLKKELGDL